MSVLTVGLFLFHVAGLSPSAAVTALAAACLAFYAVNLVRELIVILGGERVSIREYPRSKEGGRENLEGESRGSAAHERFSREILPTDRLSEGIFRILTSETPCITNILWAKP